MDDKAKVSTYRMVGKDHLAGQMRYRASFSVDKKKNANKNTCRSKASSKND